MELCRVRPLLFMHRVEDTEGAVACCDLRIGRVPCFEFRFTFCRPCTPRLGPSTQARGVGRCKRLALALAHPPCHRLIMLSRCFYVSHNHDSQSQTTRREGAIIHHPRRHHRLFPPCPFSPLPPSPLLFRAPRATHSAPGHWLGSLSPCTPAASATPSTIGTPVPPPLAATSSDAASASSLLARDAAASRSRLLASSATVSLSMRASRALTTSRSSRSAKTTQGRGMLRWQEKASAAKRHFTMLAVNACTRNGAPCRECRMSPSESRAYASCCLDRGRRPQLVAYAWFETHKARLALPRLRHGVRSSWSTE